MLASIITETAGVIDKKLLKIILDQVTKELNVYRQKGLYNNLYLLKYLIKLHSKFILTLQDSGVLNYDYTKDYRLRENKSNFRKKAYKAIQKTQKNRDKNIKQRI